MNNVRVNNACEVPSTHYRILQVVEVQRREGGCKWIRESNDSGLEESARWGVASWLLGVIHGEHHQAQGRDRGRIDSRHEPAVAVAFALEV